MKLQNRIRTALPALQACAGLAIVALGSARTDLHFLEQFAVAGAGLYFARALASRLSLLTGPRRVPGALGLARATPQFSNTNNTVPEAMRAQFGASDASRPRLMPWAVVGFVDIISSTSISNHIDLETGFEMKQRFLHAATERANESGMIMLNHTGDGFLFLANYGGDDAWAKRLVQFHRALTSDFDGLLSDLRRRAAIRSESGLRFGVSCGPVLLGCLGASATCFTAVGPDVNLASRLCDVAGRNEFVATRRVWDHLKQVLPGWPASFRNYDSLRGFDGVINAVHVGTRAVAAVPAELLGSWNEQSKRAAPLLTERRAKLRLVDNESVSHSNENCLEMRPTANFQNEISGIETPSIDWSLTKSKSS
jgi:class 3 adenylate cyclase